MHIHILACGSKLPTWVKAGCDDYLQRFTYPLHVSVQEIPLKRRTKQQSIASQVALEGEMMRKKTPAGATCIALDVKGVSLSTETFTAELQRLQTQSRDICFYIGGPDGLAPVCLQNAQNTWSLSKLTFPHTLARLLLIEQLYRAHCVMSRHPYHRD